MIITGIFLTVGIVISNYSFKIIEWKRNEKKIHDKFNESREFSSESLI